MFVEFDLQGVNQKLQQMFDAGVMMEDDLTKYTLEIFKRIVMRTPVKTGRAKNSWHVMPPNTPSDTYTYSDDQGRAFDGSLTGISTGPWDAIVGSNVEYMIALEHGHSKQAAHGMVSITLVEMSEALAKTIEARLRNAGNP